MVAKRKQKEDGHQALKARATRDSIIAAVVALINESGYSSASSTAIAKKAGITWGAVQHHFGTKEDILLAVLEMARDVYIQSLSSADLKSGRLEQRIDRFIDLVWEHYQSDLYFAFTEIVMATRGGVNKLPLSKVRMNRQLEIFLAAMVDVFDGQDVSRASLNEALRFVHRFLTGLAMDRILDPKQPFEKVHIRRIKEELLSIIQSK